MIRQYPKDSEARKIGTRGRQLVISSFDADRWDYHEKTGGDYGVDAEFEFSNNNEFRNEKFECQIKATTNINFIKNKSIISFNNFPVKTLNYALNSRLPFFFLLADITNSAVYFLLIDDECVFNAKYGSQQTTTLHIPVSNRLETNESKLIKQMLSFYKNSELR